jgi:hypothetical protein
MYKSAAKKLEDTTPKHQQPHVGLMKSGSFLLVGDFHVSLSEFVHRASSLSKLCLMESTVAPPEYHGSSLKAKSCTITQLHLQHITRLKQTLQIFRDCSSINELTIEFPRVHTPTAVSGNTMLLNLMTEKMCPRKIVIVNGSPDNAAQVDYVFKNFGRHMCHVSFIGTLTGTALQYKHLSHVEHLYVCYNDCVSTTSNEFVLPVDVRTSYLHICVDDLHAVDVSVKFEKAQRVVWDVKEGKKLLSIMCEHNKCTIVMHVKHEDYFTSKLSEFIASSGFIIGTNCSIVMLD